MRTIRRLEARSRDTTAAAESIQLQVYRQMNAERKLELVEDANRTARLLALAGLAARFPHASEDELHLRLFHLLLGTELATRAYGPLPEPPPE